MGNVVSLATGGTVSGIRTLTAKLYAAESRMDCCGDWNPAVPLPADQVAALPDLIAAADAALTPADVREFARLTLRFLEWAAMLGLSRFPEEEEARQARFADLANLYAEDLEHLPADILEDALAAVRRRHKWARLPTPADILERADEELSRRRLIKRRAETAMAAARRESTRLPMAKPADIYSPDEMAAAEAWAAKARAGIQDPPKRRDAGELRQLGKRIGFTAEELEASRKEAADAIAKRRAMAEASP
jgi:hypothetical protein